MYEITDVYLEDDRFNPVTDCRIPGAWVAIVNGEKQAFARPCDFISVSDAEHYIRDQYESAES